MAAKAALPADLARLAERDTWFSQDHVKQVIDWLETQGLALWGIEAARKQPDGKWMLLLDPILSRRAGTQGKAETPEIVALSIEEGSAFVGRYQDLMFELTWAAY